MARYYSTAFFVVSVALLGLLSNASLSAGSLREPPTRTLAPDEARAALEADWLFQADGSPTAWRTRQEIAWARELAERLARRADPPDLATELAELAALEKRLPARVAPQAGLRRRGLPAPPRGLAARWSFDDPGARAADDASGNGLHGALRGSAKTAQGIDGGALKLNGSGYVACRTTPAAIAKGGSYTVSAWVRTTSSVMDVAGNGVSSGCFLIVINRGPVRAHHWTDASGNVTEGKMSVNDGRWHHIAQVVDADSISVWVDGELDVTAKLRGSRTATTAPMCIGSRTPDEGSYRFRGRLDEFCVFERALNPRELETLHDQGRALADIHHPGEAADPELYFAVRRVKRRILMKDPLVDFSRVLFVDVPCYDALNHESMHRVWPQAQQNCGRLLVLDGLHPGGALRKLAGSRPGMFWRPDLSFDGRKVLFCYRPQGDRTFHLYEVDVDGSNPRQLTSGDYDDLDPIYMPDGHIAFLSNRGNSYARCAVGHPSYVLARCDADGKNIYIISANNEPEYTPALLHDGRVVYTRWEYTDKELFRIQSLWTMRPDGTGASAFWGNQSYWPDMLVEARPIPGSRRVMFSAQGHHDIVHGSIGIIDPSAGYDYPDGLTKVTADRPWPEVGDGPDERQECDSYHASGAFDGYRTPYPLSEELFLVSARRPEKTGRQSLLGSYTLPKSRFALYLMDVYGNRELIWAGGYDVLYAMPIRPRPRPPALVDRVAWPGPASEGRRVEPGVVYSADVFEGVPDSVRQKARHVRVIVLDYTTFTFGLKTQAPGAWGQRSGLHMHAGPPLSITGNDGFKRVLGTVPIEADGSICIEVPPCKLLHFQLLDEHYRALQTMRSSANVMPGEWRGCQGCHESHSRAPSEGSAYALRKRPVQPTPPPWGPQYTLGYERDIQPILDRYCGSCHQGDGEARKACDLTLRPSVDAGTFPEPYVTLTLGAKRDLRDFPRHCEGGVADTILPMVLPLAPESDRTIAPMTALSYKSRLIDIAMSGDHYDVKVDELSLRKLIVWVDILCPYLGEEEIRAMPDPDPADPFFANSRYPPRTPGIKPFADSPYPPRMQNAPIVDRAYAQDEFPTQADRFTRSPSRSPPKPPRAPTARTRR